MHKTVPAHIHTVARGMAEGWCCTCCRAQSASQVSDPSSEKSCKFFETQVESNTRCQRQCSADLQPCRHDEEYLRCRIRYRIRRTMSYTISYTTKPAPCPAVVPGISSCPVWNLVPQGVRNCVVCVPAKEARNHRDPAKNVFTWQT